MDHDTKPMRLRLAGAALLIVAAGALPPARAQGKVVHLEGTPENTQFGWYDNAQPPVARIRSGDTVVMETLIHGHKHVVVDELTIGQMTHRARQEQVESPGRGPHSVTGPVYVEGARPGDTLKIDIGPIVPTSYGVNFSYPGFAGAFPKHFPEGQVRYFQFDLARKRVEFAPGIEIPLQLFPGILGVARAEPGRYTTVAPGPFGGNLDINQMVSGTTLYLPVFVDGALLWTGDSHAAQGNGEVNLTALETAFKELPLTVTVLKGMKLDWPRVETPTHWIATGYDKDLNAAYALLQEQTVRLISEQRGLTPAEARSRLASTWDCRVAEVVNVVKGTYCMVPKDKNAPAPVLPRADDAQYLVTYASNTDLNKAMDDASLSMIDKLSSEKHLSRLDAYSLASMAMDCRLGPPKASDHEVHCLMPKSLWTGR